MFLGKGGEGERGAEDERDSEGEDDIGKPEKEDIFGEKWERILQRVHAMEAFLGMITAEAEEDGAISIETTETAQRSTATGGITAIKDDIALLRHKLGDFETLLQYFPMENLLESLRDLEELRNKLLRRASQNGTFNKVKILFLLTLVL